jgi:hypothetical protein
LEHAITGNELPDLERRWLLAIGLAFAIGERCYPNEIEPTSARRRLVLARHDVDILIRWFEGRLASRWRSLVVMIKATVSNGTLIFFLLARSGVVSMK